MTAKEYSLLTTLSLITAGCLVWRFTVLSTVLTIMSTVLLVLG